jgi:hypothetical protein
MRHIFAAAATVAVAACNISSVEVKEVQGVKEVKEVKKNSQSLAYLNKPVSVLSCFDFANNRTLQQKADGEISMEHGVASLCADEHCYRDEAKVATVIGGSGCVGETVYVDSQDPATAQTIGELQNRAPNYAVITNGINGFIAGGKFSEVSTKEGVTTLTLEADRGEIRKIQVMGLHIMITKDPEALDPGIREAAGFTKPSAIPAPR